MKNKLTLRAVDQLRSLRARRCAVECMKLRGESEAAEHLECAIEAEELALASMHPDDRHILNRLFIEREAGCVERLCDELECTASTIYRRRRHALAEYALRLFGASAPEEVGGTPGSSASAENAASLGGAGSFGTLCGDASCADGASVSSASECDTSSACGAGSPAAPCGEKLIRDGGDAE